MFFVIPLILPIMLSEGFSATHSISSDHFKSNNKLIVTVPAKGSSSTEKKMEAALSNKTTDLFQISGDYTFKSDVTGFTTQTTATSSSKDRMSIKDARANLSSSLKGKIIRIKNGKATMDDSNFECTLHILSKNRGVSLSINEIGYSFVNDQIKGTIKGNTLTASGDYSQDISSKAVETTLVVSGSYSVSISEVPKNKWPPVPVTLSGEDNSNHSVTLAWRDTNPAGLVKSYMIYRDLGISGFVKVATVSNSRQWTDSSTAAKTETSVLSYYVIAQNSSGKKSALSNYYDVDTAIRVFGTD